LHKKLAATLTIAIFLVSTLAVVAPAYAHFTLGDLTSTYRYHANDFDQHKDGVIGYVWPGGGQNAYTGSPNVYSNSLYPGYQSPYPGGNPPLAPNNALQLEGDEYAPYGAVLSSSTGDLIFALNATARFHGATVAFSTLYILIPPEFKIPDASQITSTITNNAGPSIRKYTLSPYDRYAPGWTLIRIYADTYSLFPGSESIHFFGGQDEWYYVRINGATAPNVAGRYFFKMFLRGSTGTTQVGGVSTAPTATYWVPTENWPVMLVKGELDPAIITGTIRYAGYNATLYGQGIQEAGMVWAHMTSKLDPYTGNNVMTCPDVTDPTMAAIPCTDAWGFFNQTAQGHYEVEGVAPGVYTLYAEAAGYPIAVIASGVTILKGQSLHFDGYLQPGAVIHGNVFTKHQFGEEPWPENSYIKIELYGNPTVSNQPDASAGTPVSYSPLPCIAGGQLDTFGGLQIYSPGGDASSCGDPRTAGEIAFPWHEYMNTRGPGHQVAIHNENNPDPQGVGPYQNWFVVGGTATPFHFEFGEKGKYGAPRDLSGMVPQLYATWINGLTPGRYYARAWVFRYVQTGLDGSTFQEYSFDITPQEWAGDVSLPIDLRLSSWVNKTVHFHNLPGTITTDGINTGAAYLYGGLYDANGVQWAWNVTTLPLPPLNPFVNPTTGLPDNHPGGYMVDLTGGSGNGVIPYAANYLDPAAINRNCNNPLAGIQYGSCNLQLWGYNDTWLGENYGIPSGTYQPKVYALGYLQQSTDYVSVTLSGTPTSVSDHVFRGAGFNFTVYSIDWERPRVNRNWVWSQPDSLYGLTSDIEIGILRTPTDQYVSGEVCDGCDAGAYAGPYGGYGHPATEDQNYLLTQQPNTYWTQADGGGRNVLPNDNAQGAFFGLEAPYATVGGWMSLAGCGDFSQCARKYGFTTGKATNTWKLSFYKPSAFDSGAYSFRGWTYGYIQNKDYSVYVMKGQVADIKINLIVGVNVTLDILFKKEHIITPTAANMSARVTLWNDQGNLVGEWMSSEGVYIDRTGYAVAADNTAAHPFGGLYNYLPGGVSLLHVNLAGLPAWWGSYGGPVDNPSISDFEIDVQDLHYFPNAGILGSPDYTGGWTAEVDFVNWYANNSNPNHDPFHPAGLANYYPPVIGLLMGESFHIIPGTTAQSGISYMEDMALGYHGADSFSFAHSMAPNHLGPYAQQGVWAINNAPNSGEASAIYEVDLNGYLTGQALAFTWSNEFRPISWYTAQVVGADHSFNFYTNDGLYEGFLTPGDYKLTLAGPGLTAQTISLSISAGQSGGVGSGVSLYLEQSNIPVPEFSGIAVVAISALAASLYLLRRRRK